MAGSATQSLGRLDPSVLGLGRKSGRPDFEGALDLAISETCESGHLTRRYNRHDIAASFNPNMSIRDIEARFNSNMPIRGPYNRPDIAASFSSQLFPAFHLSSTASDSHTDLSEPKFTENVQNVVICFYQTLNNEILFASMWRHIAEWSK